jgi:hypothetical protein
MLMAYATAYAKPSLRGKFYEMGTYAILFYLTHVITIIAVANFVFWLKDIDPRFREGEDSNFSDIPTLMEHQRRLQAHGHSGSLMGEKEKAEFFIGHIKDDVKEMAKGIKDKATGFASLIKDTATGIITGGAGRYRSMSRSSAGSESDRDRDWDDVENSGVGGNDLEGGRGKTRKAEVEMTELSAAPPASTFNPLLASNSKFAKLSNTGASSSSHSKPSPLSTIVESESEAEGDSSKVQASPSSSIDSAIYAFYAKHNPSKLDSVPEILKKYKGKEKALLAKLRKQYNINNS